MLPFETDILQGTATKNFIKVMPKVVPDQRSKFENDELFRKLSREGEIKYTGFRDRPLEERQLRFQTECREGHADVAFVATGTNMQLQFTPNAWSENPEDRIPTQDFVDFDREPGKVYLKSQFILNGVCVVWKGWMDLNRLDGIGSVDFDAERAMVEDSLYRQQIDQYNRQLRDFDERQRHYREQQERRAEAEAEEYHRLLRSRVEMFEKSHPLFLLGLDRAKRGLPAIESSLPQHESDKKRLKKIVVDTLIYGIPQANRVDPDETAPTGAVSSGSTLLANTSNHVNMRSESSTVQVPVPVKPVVGSSAGGPVSAVSAIGGLDHHRALVPNLAVAAVGLHHHHHQRPRLHLSSLASLSSLSAHTHTVTSDIVNAGLVNAGLAAVAAAGNSTMVTRAPVAAAIAPIATSCPVKLYPWKPNMYHLV